MAREIPLTQGKVALVDDEDFDWLSHWKWFAVNMRGIFYACRNRPRGEGGGTRSMHRMILPGVHRIDHKNRDGLDNRRANLRPCTTGQNNLNRGPFKTNLAAFKGVSLRRRGGSVRYYARVRDPMTGIESCLGGYAAPEDAARAYDRVARKVHGDFAYLNFPDEAEAA